MAMSSDLEIEGFVAHGYVRLTAAFSREQADGAVDVLLDPWVRSRRPAAPASIAGPGSALSTAIWA